jgi:plasmid stabilization system protein ParE
MDSEWNVVWTKRAQINYFSILDYLLENWTRKEVLQFKNRVELVLNTIQKNPRMYVASSIHKSVRRAIIDKNI